MKIIKLLLFLIFAQLVSCQTEKETGFVLEKKKLYYNSKEIALGMPIEKFTDAMGMYDRIDIDSSGGRVITDYYWKTKFISVNKHSKNDYFFIIKMKKDKKTGRLIEDNNESYEKVYSMEEIISKYGKYDSIEEQKTPWRVDKLFIWDELGITLAADRGNDKLIGNIHLQTLYVTKFRELDLGLVKTYEEERGLPVSKEVRDRRENDISIFKRRPKKEYTGNFTYNGKTINLKEIGYTGWEKGIKGLGIDNSDYNPPGDSPQWSRWIRQSSEMYITFERFTNLDEYDWSEPNREDVGDLDCFRSIVIWNGIDYMKEDEK
uniref:DUF7738 domain-containing protein n=1 Tax=Flavobacterium sp. TaxID=239 RepID=UPI00404894F8